MKRAEAIDAFEWALRREGKADRTVKNYSRMVNQFLVWVQTQAAEGKGFSPSEYMDTLISFYRFSRYAIK